MYDLGKVGNDGRHPVTYGESKWENGIRYPVEVALTHPDEHCVD